MLRSLFRATALSSVLLLVAACACSDDAPRAFEKFYDELAAGDAAALDRLSAAARARLDEEARRALLSTPPRTSIKSVTAIHDDGNRATLEVVDVLGDKDEVRMVREDGAWRVDL